MTETNVVPFGKYKGKPVSALLADRGYCEWLMGQPDFVLRYRDLFDTLVAHGKTPEDTPSHNRLQALFLDKAFCEAFMRASGLQVGIHNEGTWSMYGHATFEQRGWDVLMQCKYECPTLTNWHETFHIEVKPVVGDDYPAVLRQITGYSHTGIRLLLVDHFNAAGAPFHQVKEMFARSDITIVRLSDVQHPTAKEQPNE